MEYVIVFGGTGYVGSAIVRACEAANIPCIRASRSPSEKASDLVCDMGNKASLEDALSKLYAQNDTIRALVHAASPLLSRAREGGETRESREAHDSVARMGTEHLIEIASRYAIPHLILITSEVVLSTQKTLSLGSYPAAKRAQERLARHAAQTLPSTLVHTIAPGFLPGGLNSDLPKVFRESLAKMNDIPNSPDDVGRTVIAILGHEPRYLEAGSINPHSEVLTPF